MQQDFIGCCDCATPLSAVSDCVGRSAAEAEQHLKKHKVSGEVVSALCQELMDSGYSADDIIAMKKKECLEVVRIMPKKWGKSMLDWGRSVDGMYVCLCAATALVVVSCCDCTALVVDIVPRRTMLLRFVSSVSDGVVVQMQLPSLFNRKVCRHVYCWCSAYVRYMIIASLVLLIVAIP